MSARPSATQAADEDATVALRRGSIYLSAELYERHFASLEAVVLLRREDGLLIMPVRHLPGGGHLMKRRNSRGDRVINALDFFLDNGLDPETERELPAAWSADEAALRVHFTPVAN